MIQCICGRPAEFTGRRKSKGEFELSCGICTDSNWVHEDLLSEDEREIAYQKYTNTRINSSSIKKTNYISYIEQTPGAKFTPTQLPPLIISETRPKLNIFDKYSREVKDAFELILPVKKKGFKKRSVQIELAMKIAQTLHKSGVLVSEAGVGTGKTYAYSIPSLLRDRWVNSEGPVVFSTKTISLQEQLAGDLAELIKILDLYGIDYLVCKGRSNYVCRTRLESPSLDIPNKSEVIEWAKTSQFGDLSEIQGKVNSVECEEICVSECVQSSCSLRDNCPYVRHKRVRKNFFDGFLVCNHNLLAADLKRRQESSVGLWPEPSSIVIDEAHGLEEACRQILGVTLSPDELYKIIGLVKKSGINSFTIREAERKAHQSFEQLFNYIEKVSNGDILKDENNRFGVPINSEFMDCCRRIITALRHLSDRIDYLAGFTTSRFGQSMRSEGYLDTVDFKLNLITDSIKSLLEQPGKYYAAGELKGSKVCSLFTGPIDVDLFLYETLWKNSWNRPSEKPIKPIPVILTSGTLTERGSFKKIRSSIGLYSNFSFVSEYMGAQKLDLSGKVGIHIARDLPEPGVFADEESDAFTEAMARRVMDLLSFSRGRAMVLFTSFRRMYYVYNYLTSQREFPYKIYKQGDFSAGELLDRFRKDVSSVLLATGSFWEGVDVVGSSLSLLIMDKLPFPAKGDPLTRARIERAQKRGEDPFKTILLPEMLFRLRQGAGRLIRHEEDSGVIALLDCRALNRKYSQYVKESLPDGTWLSLKGVKDFFSILQNTISA